MKPIQKDELFAHLGLFLKTKGIELKEGSYTNGVQKGCALLTDAINLSQKGIKRAKVEIDKKVDRMRQVIHEKTAPKAKPAGQSPKTGSAKPKSTIRKPKAKPVKPGSATR
jgi:hypothetical protein